MAGWLGGNGRLCAHGPAPVSHCFWNYREMNYKSRAQLKISEIIGGFIVDIFRLIFLLLPILLFCLVQCLDCSAFGEK